MQEVHALGHVDCSLHAAGPGQRQIDALVKEAEDRAPGAVLRNDHRRVHGGPHEEHQVRVPQPHHHGDLARELDRELARALQPLHSDIRAVPTRAVHVRGGAAAQNLLQSELARVHLPFASVDGFAGRGLRCLRGDLAPRRGRLSGRHGRHASHLLPSKRTARVARGLPVVAWTILRWRVAWGRATSGVLTADAFSARDGDGRRASRLRQWRRRRGDVPAHVVVVRTRRSWGPGAAARPPVGGDVEGSDGTRRVVAIGNRTAALTSSGDQHLRLGLPAAARHRRAPCPRRQARRRGSCGMRRRKRCPP
mmetsp:Transcript_91126/g.294381  ORF Transcript_91126/g.294381 Transcript_91126/m.294381 type:complete len:308 (-) Transcript_91126:195-1118(-)